MKRKLPDWLSAYMKYTEWSESPINFHVWGGMSCIAGALQRKAFIRWGHTTLYPNLYVILIGPSGQARKGEPITIARTFLDKIDIPMIGEDNSMESIIRSMRDSLTNYSDPITKRIMFQCAVSCLVEEFAVFVGQQNVPFLAYLTNWFDSRDRWKRATKHQGTDEIIGMCFNLLAATAPDWLPSILPREAIGGGFTSRCIFVVEEGKSKIIPNPNLAPDTRRLKDDLIHDLEIIHTLVGEYKFDEPALASYVKWYEEQEESIRAGHSPIPDPIFAGYVSRRATHLKKLSMSIAASSHNDLVITQRDFKRALGLMVAAEQRMSRVFSGIGKGKFTEETEAVGYYLSNRGSATKSELMRHFFRTVDEFSLTIAVQNLSSMKLIKVIRDTSKNETTYEYIGERAKIEKQNLGNVIDLVNFKKA
jgi:hypothetical protein